MQAGARRLTVAGGQEVELLAGNTQELQQELQHLESSNSPQRYDRLLLGEPPALLRELRCANS